MQHTSTRGITAHPTPSRVRFPIRHSGDDRLEVVKRGEGRGKATTTLGTVDARPPTWPIRLPSCWGNLLNRGILRILNIMLNIFSVLNPREYLVRRPTERDRCRRRTETGWINGTSRMLTDDKWIVTGLLPDSFRRPSDRGWKIGKGKGDGAQSTAPAGPMWDFCTRDPGTLDRSSLAIAMAFRGSRSGGIGPRGRGGWDTKTWDAEGNAYPPRVPVRFPRVRGNLFRDTNGDKRIF